MSFNKIVIAGGTGYLGQCVIKHYYGTTTEVIILTRDQGRVDKNITYVQWDAQTVGDWKSTIDHADAVLNFTGKSVNCRYTEKNKRNIIDSRVLSTLAIGKAIQSVSHPPKVWINAGSAAIFGNSGDEIKIEESSLGDGFSAEVCKRWEEAFNNIDTPSTRKVFLRIGLVFGKGSWVLDPFVNLAKYGLGGSFGSGDQYISWIHETDFLNLLEWIIEREDISGVLHACSPNPEPNKVFMKLIRESIGVPFGMPHPSLFVKIGSFFIGTEPELVLTGRRVVSKVLTANHFNFNYPGLHQTLNHILKK